MKGIILKKLNRRTNGILSRLNLIGICHLTVCLMKAFQGLSVQRDS